MKLLSEYSTLPSSSVSLVDSNLQFNEDGKAMTLLENYTEVSPLKIGIRIEELEPNLQSHS